MSCVTSAKTYSSTRICLVNMSCVKLGFADVVCEVANGFVANSCLAREATSPVLSLTKILDK